MEMWPHDSIRVLSGDHASCFVPVVLTLVLIAPISLSKFSTVLAWSVGLSEYTPYTLNTAHWSSPLLLEDQAFPASIFHGDKASVAITP